MGFGSGGEGFTPGRNDVSGDFTVEGNVSASINISSSAFYGDGSNLTNVGGGSLTITIGNTVASGAGNRILYESSANKLAESTNLTFDGTTLTVATLDANGGAIDGTTIGANSTAAATVTDLTCDSLTATANLDIGSYRLTAETLESDVTTGTAPLTVSSTTVVTNLNADLLDGGDWGTPNALGSSTPAAVSATTIGASGISSLASVQLDDGSTLGPDSVTDLITLAGTGNITIKDGAYDFDIAAHDGSNGLKLGGTLITATADELNYVDGVSSAIQTQIDGKQDTLTFGIADTNALKVDQTTTAADDDYAKFTASGIEGRSYSEVKTDLSLGNVENTALSTWAGTTNVTTLGTITEGTWTGTEIAVGYGGTGLVGTAAGTIVIADGAGAPTTLSVGADETGITKLGTIATGVWQGTAITNDNLDNSTVSGIALGSTLGALSKATNSGLALTSYDGSAAVSDLAINLVDLSDAAVDVNADSIAIIDADDSDGSRKELISDLMAAAAGTGLSESSGQLTVNASQTQITTLGTLTG